MTTFSRFDVADHLDTEEDVAAYLDAAMESGDPALIARAVGTVARAQNMTRLAREVGVTREGLYKALSGDGNPSFATMCKVITALGLKMRFEPISHAD